jgi:Pyruvate/2-oxoacid:ferredoxin oxidoreductase gamma subunit
MEREVFLTGIGGQGVQLAAKVLALAATREGRGVMSLGTYGGTMRGGNTDATVVVAEGSIGTPPIVSRGWSAIVAHPRFFGATRPKLRRDGVVVFDSRLAGEDFDPGVSRSYPLDAGAIARSVEAGNAASFVLLGAFCGLTGLVSLASLEASLADALPPYRHEHLAANGRALAAGVDALPRGAAPAWGAAA